MLSFFLKKQPDFSLEWLGADINSHLLVVNENGLVDIPHSVNCIQQLRGLGIKTVHCLFSVTPIIRGNLPEILFTTKAALENALKSSAVEVELFIGAKYTVDKNFKIAKDLIALPGNYIMLEQSVFTEPSNLEEVVFNLQISGYKVILANPEQYAYYHSNHARYRRLKELGVVFQLNLMSLTSHYGPEVKNTALYLLEKRHYELAGTDVQNEKQLNMIQKVVLHGSLFDKIKNYKFKNEQLLKQ